MYQLIQLCLKEMSGNIVKNKKQCFSYLNYKNIYVLQTLNISHGGAVVEGQRSGVGGVDPSRGAGLLRGQS